MNINLNKRIQPVSSSNKSKHSTEDPNENRRRQLGLVHECTASKNVSKSTDFSSILRNTIESAKKETDC